VYGIASVVKLMQLPNFSCQGGIPSVVKLQLEYIYYVLGLLNFLLPLVLLLIIDHILLSGNSPAAAAGLLKAVKDWELCWPRAPVNLRLFTAVLNYS